MNKGLKPSEIKLVESIIEENQEIIAEHWNKFFNKETWIQSSSIRYG